MATPTLRISMLAPFGIRPKGTLSARMLPLAQALRRRGHAVCIAAPPVQNPEDAGTRIVYDGVPVTHIAVSQLPEPAHLAQQVLALYRACLLYTSLLSAGGCWIRRASSGVLHPYYYTR